MVQAIFNLITNSFFTGFALIGAGTLLNKIGVALKTMEEDPEDGYRKAFDKTMVQSLEEINFCVDSLKLIGKTSGKAGYILSDIVMGNKVVQKDKNGKLIISEKSKLYNQYNDQISELNVKVQKYQEELERLKKIESLHKNKKQKNKNNKYSDSEDDNNKQHHNSDDDDEEFVLEEKK